MQLPLKEIVQDVRSLEPFPSIAARVLELSSNDEVAPRELIEVIQLDPALTAKVLRLCNSAFYGFQREISTLEEAGNMLGVRTLVSLVLTSTANRYFHDVGQASGRSQEHLWAESVTHAVAGRMLAERIGLADRERAYTVGLLQNIGCMVLERYCRQARERVAALARVGHSRIEAEKYALGLHHAELGARLATHWDLPPVLTDTIRFHHAPEGATVDKVLTSIVHLAETLAATQIREADGLPYEVSEAALQLSGLARADVEEIGTRLDAELEKARELLEL